MLNWKPTSKSRKGMPRKQWKDNFTENLNMYGLRPTDAENKDAWKNRF